MQKYEGCLLHFFEKIKGTERAEISFAFTDPTAARI